MAERLNPFADLEPGDHPPRDLKRVSADLRELVASLRTDRDKHAHPAHPEPAHLVQAPPPAPAAAAAAAPRPGARPSPDAADLERRRLAAELTLKKEEVAHASAERELNQRIAQLEAENRRLTDQYVTAQERAGDLALRFAALERLHGGLGRGETLAALQEIVINIVGSEELAVLALEGERLSLIQSFGIDPEAWRSVAVRPGALARAAAGELWIAGRDAEGPGDGLVSACVPLRAGARVVGVLVIFRLLGHKPGLGEADLAVLGLISDHAGIALHLRPAGAPA
jgi:hypothetical protein